jgi:methylenetetrahydrofolate dehydrogenase (NAD+)
VRLFVPPPSLRSALFHDKQDQYLQNVVDVSKDVEGLHHKYVYNMYHNIRFLDDAHTKKCILPCTPLGIVKVMEYVGVYNMILPYGNRLHGRVVTIINRSEIVGRPLAALLANDGAKVYSVDINGIQEFDRGTGLSLKKHEVNPFKVLTLFDTTTIAMGSPLGLEDIPIVACSLTKPTTPSFSLHTIEPTGQRVNKET